MGTSRFLVLPALLVLAIGCSARTPLPAPPFGSTALRLVPVENVTGLALPLSADPGLDGLCGRPEPTVPSRLDLELQRALIVRGFTLDDSGSADVLQVRILRWDPAVPVGNSVTVSLDARLVAPDGSVRWEATRRDWTIQSPWRDADMLDTYASATETVARLLTDDWCAPRS